jgi:carbon catabolite-derepressing protein kinase
MDEN